MENATVYNLPSDENLSRRLKLLASYLHELSKQQPQLGPAAKWLWPIRWAAIDIDSANESDVFVGHVFNYLKDKFGAGNRTGNAANFEKQPLKSMAIFRFSGVHFYSMIGLVYYEDLVYVFACGDAPSPDIAQVVALTQAVAFAETECTKTHPSHKWQAVVGQLGSIGQQNSIAEFSRFSVGSLVLERCQFNYEDRRTAYAPSLNTCASVTWGPVLVHGVSPGFDWRGAEFASLMELNRLCALLSLESSYYWNLVESPRSFEWGPIQFPDKTALGSVKKLFDSPIASVQSTSSTIIDSARLSRMWTKCINDPRLVRPLEAFHQAISLRHSHPSFALVGYVAAIEEAGKLILEADEPVDIDKCITCGKQTRSSSGERFRAALSLVLPQEKIKTVSQNLYRWRSGTAHAGRMYSSERSFGRRPMSESLLINSSESLFEVRGVDQAGALARSLLLILLDRPLRLAD